MTEVKAGAEKSSTQDDNTTGHEHHSMSDLKVEKSLEAPVDSQAHVEREQKDEGAEIDDRCNELHGAKLVFLVASLMIGTFMIGLDSQILATAIPKITSEFHSLDDISWYASIYQLSQIALQPTFGKAYTFFNTKWTYLSALVFFEIGSIICATAPSSPVLIFGRAMTGAASSAIFAGDQNIFVHSISLRKRPIAMSCLGAAYGISSMLGPPIGGLITDSRVLSWRFCFWINLPFGALTALTVSRVYQPPRFHSDLSLRKKLDQLDFIGTVLFIATMVTLFLALNWGGSAYPWSAAKVWGCLLGFGLLLIAFICSQFFNQARAMIQRRVITNRTVLVSCLFIFGLQMSIQIQTYYLSIYYQAVRGTSASGSGVRILPYSLVGSPTTFLTALVMSKTGQYVPMMPVGSAILTLGSALFNMLTVTLSIGYSLAFEIVAALGYGICTQVSFFSVQNVLPTKDAPMGISLVILSQGLGAALGQSIAQNIFDGSLTSKLRAIKGIMPDLVLKAGASAAGVRSSVPSAHLAEVLEVYNSSLKPVWSLAAAAAGFAFISSLFMEWKKVRKE